MGLIIKNARIYAFIFTFKIEGDDKPKNITIVNYNQMRARQMFNRFIAIHKLNIDENNIIITRAHKNKHNKHWFTEEFIQREEETLRIQEGN